MRNIYHALFTLTFLVLGAVAWLFPTTGTESELAAGSDAASMRWRQAIAFHERRLAEDPTGAIDMSQLAALYMEEGRMSGDERNFVVAESLARRSLAERTRRNGRSSALLTSALLAQHRFAEAARVARELVESEPDEPAYRALMAETLMELGDYDRAIDQLGSVRAHREDLGIAPRFARWAELTGQIAEARRILRAARDDAARRIDLAGTQRAWFSLRLADLELRHGNLRSAAAAILDGLRESPDDWRLVLARGRWEAASGSWEQAVKSAEQVLVTLSSPDALALLATAHRYLGHEEEAEVLEMALGQVALRDSGAVHRGWAMTLLDRGRDADRIVTAAAGDTLVRQDVHTLDLLAWALHRAGRTSDALPIIRRAIRLGTVEPSIRYHAGMIEYAAGDTAAARQHLESALGRERALAPDQVRAIRRSLSASASINTRN